MEKFRSKLHFFFLIMCILSVECNIQCLQERQSNLNAGNEEAKNESLIWTRPFNVSTYNFDESKNWNNFLHNLYCTFSEYKVQIARRKNKIPIIGDFGKKDCDIKKVIEEIERTKVTEKSFKIFLSKIEKCNITVDDSIKDNVLSEIKSEELNHVLNLTLRNRLHLKCEETQMYIKGNYITTGDIIDILLLKRKEIDDECKTFLSSDKMKFINIFAISTFFIDFNINSSIINSRNIALMTVIAPKWENTDENKIELKGEDGELSTVRNGLDGKPGKPGGPGANFFGIGSEFVNGKNLKISVSGGNGSPGQEGKRGENGIDGTTPSKDVLSECNYMRLCQKEIRNRFKCKSIQCETRHVYNAYYETVWCIYEVFGKTGTKGRDGGKGGKGGRGGYPGNIGLIELSNPSQISLLKNTGANGADGKGGAGGIGGKTGNTIIVKCEKFDKYIMKTYSINERVESGQNGIDGGNSYGLEYPRSPVIIKDLDKVKIINEYKSYIRENLHDSFTNYSLNKFLNQLETNYNVKKLYDTIGLVDELTHLEEHFQILNKRINFVPFYQSFINRVSEYAYAPKEVGDLKTYKSVLCYLYTAALSRIHSMMDNIESNLIVDIYAYLSSVKNDIDKVKDLKNAKYKEMLINKYKDEYKYKIDIKVNEAKEFITKEITPEIDRVGNEIDIEIEALVNEVIHLKEQAIKEREYLIEKQQRLQNVLGLQGIFSVFKIFGGIITSLGSMVAIAGSVIETGNTIAESFISDNTDGQNNVLELPQSVSELKFINQRIENIVNRRIKFLENSLQSISLEIIKNPDILGSMSFKILSIKGKLNKLDKKKLNLKEIKALQNELDETLKMEEEKLDRRDAKEIAVMKNLKTIVHLSTLFSESYNKYKNNVAKLDAIKTAIEQNEEKLERLKMYEEKIYDSIMPMLQNMQNDLQDIISKLGTKSKVALDVTKWRVESTLRDMALLMHQVTRGFQVENNVARCIQKLEVSMDVLISVHGYIQDYQNDKNLASYIAKISSVTASDIIIANNAALQEVLRQAVRKLEITVRSNIVLQRYKVAINAFKQFVFPFAHNYFKDLILPSHLTLSDDKSNTPRDDLISKASVEIEKIYSKLEDYKNTITNRDTCIGIGGFQSGYVSSKPFFIWKNEHYNDIISKILSGDQAILKADVKNSASLKDAIKFNIIEFNFKSRNETLQTEINNKLKGFQVTVTHLGNSNYRYENKIYELITGSQELWYYFEKKANGEPMSFSLSYKKIMQGNVTLSPYALWKIKLDTVTDHTSFKDLAMYKDSVDLTLEGYGYFLNKKSKNCIDLMVDKYYQAVDTYYDLSSKNNSYIEDNVYPFQDDNFKTFKIFKGFS